MPAIRGLRFVACDSWPAVHGRRFVAGGSWPAVRGHRLDVIIFTERSCDNIAMGLMLLGRLLELLFLQLILYK